MAAVFGDAGAAMPSGLPIGVGDVTDHRQTDNGYVAEIRVSPIIDDAWDRRRIVYHEKERGYFALARSQIEGKPMAALLWSRDGQGPISSAEQTEIVWLPGHDWKTVLHAEQSAREFVNELDPQPSLAMRVKRFGSAERNTKRTVTAAAWLHAQILGRLGDPLKPIDDDDRRMLCHELLGIYVDPDAPGYVRPFAYETIIAVVYASPDAHRRWRNACLDAAAKGMTAGAQAETPNPDYVEAMLRLIHHVVWQATASGGTWEAPSCVQTAVDEVKKLTEDPKLGADRRQRLARKVAAVEKQLDPATRTRVKRYRY